MVENHHLARTIACSFILYFTIADHIVNRYLTLFAFSAIGTCCLEPIAVCDYFTSPQVM